MWMVGIDRTGVLPQEWNVNGLGWARIRDKTMDTAAILHWSGKTKGVCAGLRMW